MPSPPHTNHSLLHRRELLLMESIYKQGTEQKDKVQEKSHLPSTMLPSFWKTLSSHHWQWMRYRTFFAESSAGVGPRRTLTTTRTKCSRATASSTSMPLLQRAAALGEKHTKSKLNSAGKHCHGHPTLLHSS